MKCSLTLAAIIIAMCRYGVAADVLAGDTVLVDNFMNRFTGGPDSGNFNQTDLGEAYGLARFNIPDSGNGTWVIYYDTLGTTVTDGKGVILNQDSLLPKSVFPFDSVLKKPVLHLIFHPEQATKADFTDAGTGYPWGGFEADFPGDTFFDLSKMSAIRIKAKGVANLGFRVSVTTQPLIKIGAWGYHGTNISLDTGWSWITIDTSQLIASPDDPLAAGFSWDSVKSMCNSLAFDVNTADTKASNVYSAEIYIDSVVLVGLSYTDLGFTYPANGIKANIFSRSDRNSMIRASVTNNMINISYSLKTSGSVAIDLVNASGRKVMDLAKGSQTAHAVVSSSISVASLPAGVYFIRANLDGSAFHKKISIVK
jgi:Secretion system C-terminal sorting domain